MTLMTLTRTIRKKNGNTTKKNCQRTIESLASTALTLNLLAPPTVGARINPQAANVIYMYIYDYIYIYIYGAPILDVSRSHTTTHQSR